MTYYLTSDFTSDVSISFKEYFKKIFAFPILNEAEEKELATQWIEHNDKAAAQKLVTSHLKLVCKIAMLYKYRGCNLPIMDLVSEGTLGLMEAVKKFDLKKNCRLATYALYYIKAKIHNFIMDSFSLVKLSSARVTKKLFSKYKDIVNSVSDDDLQNIADEVDTSKKNVNEMKGRFLARDCSLNKIVGESQKDELQTMLKCERSNQEILAIEQDERSKYLKAIGYACLNILDEQERDIIAHRILAEKPMKLKEMAEKYGLSAERIRQKQEIALQKIRNYLKKVNLIQSNLLTN